MTPLPPMCTDLQNILGTLAMRCGGTAALLRLDGMEIPTRIEDEQAHVIYWLLGLYAEHGMEWARVADEKLKAIKFARALKSA